MKNQDQLNNYFNTIWKSNLGQYKFSGWALIDKIQPGESVIDVGCGHNPFKGKIPNLVGLDPANDAADYRCSIEDFNTDSKFDVAFCLGSLNFGDDTDITHQIEKVISLLNPTARIYWRCNPGTPDHNNEQCKDLPFYGWTVEKHQILSAKYGFTLAQCEWDNGRRIYAEWVRKDHA